MTTATKRVLPADVYDALEMSALAYGGIGARHWTDAGSTGYGADPLDVPFCISGHARACDPSRTVNAELHHADISIVTNDTAVRAINARKRGPLTARVTFAEWCAELGVERGA